MSRISFNSPLIVGVAAAACLALGGAASAEAQAQDDGWYVGGSVPLMFIDDSESTATTSFGQGTIHIRSTVRSEHDTGFKFGGVLGRQFGSGFRVEGEIYLARAKVSKLTHSSISLSGLPPGLNLPLPEQVPIPVSGSAEQLGAMANVWYDLDIGDGWTPYIGGGLGFVRIDQGDLSYDPNAVKNEISKAVGAAAAQNPQLGQALAGLQHLATAEVPRLSATDTVLAYQIGTGVGFALSEAATLQIGYRLQAINGLSFSGTNDMVSTMSETDLRIHFLELGIRYRF